MCDDMTPAEIAMDGLITTIARMAGLKDDEISEFGAGLDTIVADITDANDIPDVLRALADTIDYQINGKDYPGRNRTRGLPSNVDFT